MDFIQEHAKAIAAAASTITVLLLRPYVTAVADPSFEPALDLVFTALVTLLVYSVPNKPREEHSEHDDAGHDAASSGQGKSNV